MPFTFEPLDISEIIEITPKMFTDDSGVFTELYKASDFKAHGIGGPFVQVNHSVSKAGVLRGLHYQKDPCAQGKLLSVGRGEIFDVAVDIRKGSPSYGKWVGRSLSGEKKNMLYIPPGFAHGFYVVSDEAEVVYYCTAEYSKEHEAGIIWNDPAVNITWPSTSPLLSAKDELFPLLAEADNTFTYE